MDLSVVIPAKNEAASIGRLVEELQALSVAGEIIVVNDGSDDDTGEEAARAGARVVVHPASKGNGAAIKAGARAAKSEWVLFMDADGQHQPGEIRYLLERAREGIYDMVVGSRSREGQASIARHGANAFYNWFSSMVTGQEIKDLTSGFRLVRRERFLEFLHLLPNQFSYPTTSTMCFIRAGYTVGFVPVSVKKRTGKSHIKPIRDGIRFLIIIFKVSTLYSPMRVFFPLAMVHFVLGLVRYGYTYFTMGTFTNMSALLIIASIQIFLIGLVSEQIAALLYSRRD